MGSLLLLAACAHQPATVAESEDALGRAYEEVASGTRDTAHAGGFLVAKEGDSVRVMREAPGGGMAPDVTDAWIAARVKGKVDVKRVQVESAGGQVTLRGNVDSRGQAMKAVRQSLETDGVTAVSSELQYPGQLRAKTNTTRF